MGIYERYVLAPLVHRICGLRPARRQRAKVVPKASGTVLEIGFGSGLNLPFYRPEAVDRVWALEPSREMWALAEEALRATPLPVDFLEAPAEEVPLETGSVDTILVTYALCTVRDLPAALSEARRVLKEDGTFVFCEHGAAPDEDVLRWQNRLNPLWKRLAGGCNLNRDIPSLLVSGGFRVAELSTMYLPGWRPGSFNFWGTASPISG